VSVNEVGWDKGDNQPADNHRVSCANGNANHLLGTGFYIHKGIISAVKTVEFISGRMSYIGLWCDITVLSAHAPTEDKSDYTKDSFYGDIECMFDQFP